MSEYPPPCEAFDEQIPFLARYRQDGTIIGVLWAWDWEEAFQLIDEYTNPYDVELLPLTGLAYEDGFALFFDREDGEFQSWSMFESIADDQWHQRHLESREEYKRLNELAKKRQQAADLSDFIKRMNGALRCRSTTPPTSEKK